MAVDLDTLNSNQREAVSWSGGPLLVLAGPGSGKTHVLTSRVVRILEEGDANSVLALTFTTKAAAEMRARVDRLLGQRAERAHVCTFHSFSADLLRQHGSHLNLRSDFSLITQHEDRIAMIEEAAACLHDDGEAVPADRRNVLTLVDRLFADSYDGGAQAPALGDTPAWVPRLFASYCRALVAANRLDFGSLLHFAGAACRKAGRRAGRAAGLDACVRGRVPGHKPGAVRPATAARPPSDRPPVRRRRRGPDHLPVERREPRATSAIATGLRHARRAASGVLSLSAVRRRPRQSPDRLQHEPISGQDAPACRDRL